MRARTTILTVFWGLALFLCPYTRAHASPDVPASMTPAAGVICLRDADKDGFIRATALHELSLAPSAEECARMNGAVAERDTEANNARFNRMLDSAGVATEEELLLYLAALERYEDSQLRVTPSPTASFAPQPPSYEQVVLGINGPIPGVRAGGLLANQTLTRIRERIAPPLNGRRYKITDDPKTTFDCQDFSEVAENAYPSLTITGVECLLMCRKRGLLPKRGSAWEKVDGFEHMFLDYHEGGMIYFLEPQTANTSRLVQFDLDLNRDGIVSYIEDGPFSASPLFRYFDRRCVEDSKIVCRTHSFDDRSRAYDYFSSRGRRIVQPPKLPRSVPQ